MKITKLPSLLLPALLASCVADDLPDVSSTSEPLSSPRDPIDCGFNQDRTCKSDSLLADNLRYQTAWDPCFGGGFSWTASYNLETNWDYACVGGAVVAGGCSSGTKLTGVGSTSGKGDGRITLDLKTDGSNQSIGITNLTAVCDEAMYTGVLVSSPNAFLQQVYRGMTWNTFIDTWTTASSQGWRLSRVEVFYKDSSGFAYFDAVFDPGSGPYGLNAGISLPDLKSLTATNNLNGMLLADAEAQQTAGGVVYVAVYKAGSGTQHVYDGLATGFKAWATPYLDDNYRVTTLESYQDDDGTTYGKQRLTAVVTRTGVSKYTGGEWSISTGQEYAKLARAWTAAKNQGLALARLESRIDASGLRRYDAVFHLSNGGAQELIPPMRQQQFLAALNTHKANGLALIDYDRVKASYIKNDPMREERGVTNEYPAPHPEWMSRADVAMRPPGAPIAGGYTLALSRDGELLGAASSGEIGDGTRMVPDAHWDYLSVSKVLTGLAALKVAQDLDLDIHQEKIMPWIQGRLHPWLIGFPGDGWDLWDITIWEALTHYSKLIAPGCNDPMSEWNVVTAANLVPGAGYAYSGGNSCMLRLFVEEASGMKLEDYFRQRVAAPMGVHDLDCDFDPEHLEVLVYEKGVNEPGAPGNAVHVVNNQCNAGGFVGRAMSLLAIMNGMRNPGVFNDDTLSEFRKWEMTFYLDLVNGLWSSGMTGGLPGSNTFLVQFPQNPSSYLGLTTTSTWHNGVQAVLFTNFTTGISSIIDSMVAAPQ